MQTYGCQLFHRAFLATGCIICRYDNKGQFHAKCDFLAFFKLSPFQGLNSLGLTTWFMSSIGLLLHRSNARSYSKPPVLSDEPPKWGIKWRLSNVIKARTCFAHTGSGRGSEFLASVAGWLKNNRTRFEVHSCYGSRDISILKRKFGKHEIDPFLVSCHWILCQNRIGLSLIPYMALVKLTLMACNSLILEYWCRRFRN